MASNVEGTKNCIYVIEYFKQNGGEKCRHWKVKETFMNFEKAKIALSQYQMHERASGGSSWKISYRLTRYVPEQSDEHKNLRRSSGDVKAREDDKKGGVE